MLLRPWIARIISGLLVSLALGCATPAEPIVEVTVDSVFPADLQDGVSALTQISVSFTGGLRTAPELSGFAVLSDFDIPLETAFDSDSGVLTAIPRDPLPEDELVSLTLSPLETATSRFDGFGWQFRVLASPPELTDSTPNDGDQNHAWQDPLRLIFSEAMDPGFGSVRYRVNDIEIGDLQPQWVAPNEAIILPDTLFPPCSAIEMILQDFRDLAGLSLTTQQVSFTTERRYRAVEVMDVSPSDDLAKVCAPLVDLPVVVTFSEGLDPVFTPTLTVTRDGQALPGAVTGLELKNNRTELHATLDQISTGFIYELSVGDYQEDCQVGGTPAEFQWTLDTQDAMLDDGEAILILPTGLSGRIAHVDLETGTDVTLEILSGSARITSASLNPSGSLAAWVSAEGGMAQIRHATPAAMPVNLVSFSLPAADWAGYEPELAFLSDNELLFTHFNGNGFDLRLAELPTDLTLADTRLLWSGGDARIRDLRVDQTFRRAAMVVGTEPASAGGWENRILKAAIPSDSSLPTFQEAYNVQGNFVSGAPWIHNLVLGPGGSTLAWNQVTVTAVSASQSPLLVDDLELLTMGWDAQFTWNVDTAMPLSVIHWGPQAELIVATSPDAESAYLGQITGDQLASLALAADEGRIRPWLGCSATEDRFVTDSGGFGHLIVDSDLATLRSLQLSRSVAGE